jgi:hypothetical protein
MGVCHDEFASIHTLIDSDLTYGTDCVVSHVFSGGVQFWTLSWPLDPGYERKIDEFRVGRVNNVRSTIRLTREMSAARL